MNNAKLASAIQSNFDLKTQTVNLTGFKSGQVEHLSLAQLEGMRSARKPVSASKFGLETICEASCDTGAQ